MKRVFTLGEELQFSELSLKLQTRLLNENRQEIIDFAVTSQYPEIWEKILGYSDVTQEVLEKLLQNIVSGENLQRTKVSEYVQKILKRHGFILSDSVRKSFLKSKRYKEYFLLDFPEGKEDLLEYAMEKIAFDDEQDCEELWNQVESLLGYDYEYEFIERLSKSKKGYVLNFVLKFDFEPNNIIYLNILNSQMEKIETDADGYFLAEDFADTVLGNLLSFHSVDINYLLLKKIISIDSSELRAGVAKYEWLSNESLNFLFNNEILNEGYQCCDVTRAIIGNPSFSISEENRKLAACYEIDDEVRKMIAMDPNTPASILELMYTYEVIEGRNIEVLEAIELNLAHIEHQEKNFNITLIQRLKIIKILFEMRKDKNVSCNKILNQIMEVLK